MPIKLLIADDHGVLRAGLRALLSIETDVQVIAEAATGKEALLLAQKLLPDIILMDISMPEMGGIEATRHLKATLPQIKVLILTVEEDESLLQEAVMAGASGYIIKRAVGTELIDAIKAVWRGDIYIHPAMTRALLKLNTPLYPAPVPSPPKDQETEKLTPREVEVLTLIAQGYTNRQTADKLTLSIRTVESHRANIMNKLHLQSRVELVRYAKENGFIV